MHQYDTNMYMGMDLTILSAKWHLYCPSLKVLIIYQRTKASDTYMCQYTNQHWFR